AKVHRAAQLGELRIEPGEKPEAIRLDGATQRETREKVLGAVPLRIVLLVCGVESSPARWRSTRAGIVTGVIVWRAIHCGVVVLGNNGTMVGVAAFFHDDIGHATQSAAVLRFDARSFHLYFLDEIE